MNGLALFAGVGGLDLGIQLCIPSSRTVCFVEREAYPASVLRAKMEEGRLHKAPIWSDVTTFDGRPFVEKVDYISAGFPCQPWSVAGKQKGADDERWLWDDIKRIICEVRPRFLFLENVPGIVNGGIDPILRDLAEIGFNAEWGMLKASEVGARHHRNRFFLFGYVSNSKCFIDGYGGFHKINPGLVSQRKGDLRRSNCDKSRLQSIEEKGSSERIFSDSRCKPGKIQVESKFTVIEVPKRDPWWEVEPSVGRVVDGMAHRVDRLRACGNGVVPLQAAVAYSILIERAIQRGGLIAN